MTRADHAADLRTFSPLRDRVAADIRGMILGREALPGTLLRLQPIAERAKTSTTPVREALVLLEKEGWVRQEQNRGFRVAVIERRDVADLADLQEYVWAKLARRSALEIDEATLARLTATDAELQAVPPAVGQQGVNLNLRVHALIASAARSPRLEAFLEVSHFVRLGLNWTDVPGWFDYNHRGHGLVISALERRDAEAAARAMAEHVRGAWELLFAYLDGIKFFEGMATSGASKAAPLT